MRLFEITLLGCVVFAATANAQDDPYQITTEERAACTPDATRLCSGAYPDERKLVSCMTANRKSLSANCAAVFRAGKTERGLK